MVAESAPACMHACVVRMDIAGIYPAWSPVYLLTRFVLTSNSPFNWVWSCSGAVE